MAGRQRRDRTLLKALEIRLRAQNRAVLHSLGRNDTKLQWIIGHLKKLHETGQRSLFWIILSTFIGLFAASIGLVVNMQTVIGWFAGPKPRFDGQATINLDDSGSTASLRYRFAVSLSNVGDSLGGGGGLIVLRPGLTGAAPVAVAAERVAMVDRPGISRNTPAGQGLSSNAMPERLLVCLWQDKGRSGTTSVFLRRADEHTINTDLLGRFANSSVGYVYWAVMPQAPNDGPLTAPETCTAAIEQARGDKLREVGLVEISPATLREATKVSKVC